MAPAVKRLLPPASSSGARSSTSTDAPCSAADNAAHKAALPPPTITTSAEAGSMSRETPDSCCGPHTTETARTIPEAAGVAATCRRRGCDAILAELTAAWDAPRLDIQAQLSRQHAGLTRPANGDARMYAR